MDKVVPIKKRTKKHKHSSVTYLDQERLRIVFFSIVVKVQSINQVYGPLKDFVRRHKLHGVTNGRVLVISEMMIPGAYLLNLAESILKPIGLGYGKDFVFVVEQPLQGVEGTNELLGYEIPECRDIPWLGSIISKQGNFVWLNGCFSVAETISETVKTFE
jgi:hypothetical protein